MLVLLPARDDIMGPTTSAARQKTGMERQVLTFPGVLSVVVPLQSPILISWAFLAGVEFGG